MGGTTCFLEPTEHRIDLPELLFTQMLFLKMQFQRTL